MESILCVTKSTSSPSTPVPTSLKRSTSIKTSLESSIRPPPEDFDSQEYKQHIQKKARTSESIVFDTVFSPDGEYGICVNNFGMMGVWRIGTYMVESYWDETSHDSNPLPSFSFQAHEEQIYSLAFAGTSSDSILISAGDQEIKCWKWKTILKFLNEDISGLQNPEPCAIFPNSQAVIGFKRALAPINETNDVAINYQTHHMFTASGDGSCYEWDLESQKLVRTFKGHKDYLHCVEYLTNTLEIATGSEDGTIGIWDVRSSKNISFLRPECNGSSVSSKKWIGCMDIDSTGSWLIAGGGSSDSTFDVQNSKKESGVFGMWHIPSRAQIFCQTNAADVHGIAFFQDDIVTVGNRSCVNYWDRSSGTKKSTISTTVPSCYFASVNKSETNSVIAVGGTSPYIDIFSLTGVRAFSFYFA